MSMRLPDLARWPLPPMDGARSADTVAVLAPVTHTWPLMPIQLKWLERCTTKYGFDNVDETLRHLIYLSNAEPNANKRLIFRIKRCLHCHVGARASRHVKVDLVAQVHAFQMQWLNVVTDKCDIKSVEKSVRIICDYYQSRVKQAELEEEGGGVGKELELFSVRRAEDPRLAEALARNAAANTNNDAGENYAPNSTSTTASNDTGRNGGKMGCDLKNLASNPAACSAEETLEAIRRCQVGRGSTSYAEARGESREETEKRREKELKVEESDEAKKERKLIGKALGSVMGM
mmetsp:Transcript_24531/g.53149  ORF Transcript_24531/g.53149 Transcript_24531/m.53149 type:complete len:290 (-) Transcript_24531:124-993(-)